MKFLCLHDSFCGQQSGFLSPLVDLEFSRVFCRRLSENSLLRQGRLSRPSQVVQLAWCSLSSCNLDPIPSCEAFFFVFFFLFRSPREMRPRRERPRPRSQRWSLCREWRVWNALPFEIWVGKFFSGRKISRKTIFGRGPQATP